MNPSSWCRRVKRFLQHPSKKDIPMRELRAEELHFVAGGLAPITDLPGMTVHPEGGGGSNSPPPGGNPPSPIGGGGGVAPKGGGNISTQAAAGIARIQSELGVDLTAYATMSPTLAQEIANATATWNFHFKWDSGSSFTDWNDQVSGTIYINAAYKNDDKSFVQQMTHELEHVAHRVSDRPSQTTAEVYISHYLETEGYCTLANERVQHEIKAAGGGDIRIAGAVGNRAYYDAEYDRVAAGQETSAQAAHNIGVYYGQNETTRGQSYDDYYRSEYRRLGGHE
jgi:hypothetical protein